jgi:hypothetical protein
MRMVLGIAVGAILLASAVVLARQDEQPPSRYGVVLNTRLYPQANPKEALASVVSAMENGRIDYLLAHLSDPAFVENRVKQYHGGNFDDLVRETRAKLASDPGILKELRRFAKEGEWEVGESAATARLKDVKDRQVYLRKIGARWYLENRQKPETTKSETPK